MTRIPGTVRSLRRGTLRIDEGLALIALFRDAPSAEAAAVLLHEFEPDDGGGVLVHDGGLRLRGHHDAAEAGMRVLIVRGGMTVDGVDRDTLDPAPSPP